MSRINHKGDTRDKQRRKTLPELRKTDAQNMSDERYPCMDCKTLVLASTIAKTNGRCMPCSKKGGPAYEKFKGIFISAGLIIGLLLIIYGLGYGLYQSAGFIFRILVGAAMGAVFGGVLGFLFVVVLSEEKETIAFLAKFGTVLGIMGALFWF